MEVKKIGSPKAQIALNSSYPKAKLFANDPMLTTACRECESWTEKDIIYAIGVVNESKLKLLWLVYGDCYAASKGVYERIKHAISRSVNQIATINLTPTKELGRVNRVDPLGITYLRIRGMWGIQNPLKVYNYIDLRYQEDASFQLIVIMRESKYLSFPKQDREGLESILSSQFSLKNQLIKSPDNPAQFIPAVSITYKV